MRLITRASNWRPNHLSRLSGLALVWIIATLIAVQSAAAGGESQGPISTGFFGNIAIGGHDTVGYHTDEAIGLHKEVAGNKTWVHEWRGARWQFASQQSYDKFKANPDKYRPAYGGFCSNALSLGEGLIRTDGTHWEIFGDRLHLFFAARGRDRWLDGDHAQYIEQAATAWREITGFDDL